LLQFAGQLRYGDVEILTEDATDDDPRVFDQSEVRLLDFEQGSVFSYQYDFGDSWWHTIVVEEFLTLATTPKHGSCLAGERARPPEDVGGVPGFERLLETIGDRDDPKMPKPFSGVADTLIWNGSICRSWTRTSAMLCARTSNAACINQSRNLSRRNEVARSKVNALKRNRTIGC
jgi:hypothetical protein